MRISADRFLGTWCVKQSWQQWSGVWLASQPLVLSLKQPTMGVLTLWWHSLDFLGIESEYHEWHLNEIARNPWKCPQNRQFTWQYFLLIQNSSSSISDIWEAALLPTSHFPGLWPKPATFRRVWLDAAYPLAMEFFGSVFPISGGLINTWGLEN